MDNQSRLRSMIEEKPIIKLFFCFGSEEYRLVKRVQQLVNDKSSVSGNSYYVNCKDWKMKGPGSHPKNGQERFNEEILDSNLAVFVVGEIVRDGIKEEIRRVKNSLIQGNSDPWMVFLYSRRSSDELLHLKKELGLDGFNKIIYSDFSPRDPKGLAETIFTSVRDWYNKWRGNHIKDTLRLYDQGLKEGYQYDKSFILDFKEYLLRQGVPNNVVNCRIGSYPFIKAGDVLPKQLLTTTCESTAELNVVMDSSKQISVPSKGSL